VIDRLTPAQLDALAEISDSVVVALAEAEAEAEDAGEDEAGRAAGTRRNDDSAGADPRGNGAGADRTNRSER
jgi:hypothetical protein